MIKRTGTIFTGKILTPGDSNPKTAKGEKLGYITAILHLAPWKSAGGTINVCPWEDECGEPCLDTAGHGGIDSPTVDGFRNSVHRARVLKTRWLFTDRANFMACLTEELEAHVRRCNRLGMLPAFRPNGTSDLAWEGLARAGGHWDRWTEMLTVYDYTKSADRARTQPYPITLSRTRNNTAACIAALREGVNVAAVFSTKKGQPLPATWEGFEIIDGDEHDLRFRDPRGVVVGLRAKGKAKKITTDGFVIQVAA